MKLFQSMTPHARQEYIHLLGEATGRLTPPDAMYVLFVVAKPSADPKQEMVWKTNAQRQSLPALLREMADAIEQENKELQDKANKN